MAKNAKKINSKQISTENEMMRFIKMIIIVTIVFGLFYALTIFINKEETEQTPDDTSASIQYDEILIGNIFSQSNNNYYVLVKENADKNVQVYEAYLSIYSNKANSKRVYTANLNNLFNSKYIGETMNLVDDLSKLTISNTVLLEIEDGKIKSSYETDETIRTILQQLTKEETE